MLEIAPPCEMHISKTKIQSALALTSRKLVRLSLGLLTKEKLYSTDKTDALL